MPSWIASSFSQGDAFISSNGERTITLTSLPPRRLELRQQSIAVLPPPRTMTRLPIDVTWPKRHRRQPVDADVDVRRRLAGGPGSSRSRPRGAPEPTKTASQPSASRARIESIRVPPRNSTPSFST